MNNLKVFAESTINGGSYDNIMVFGRATIIGELDAKSISVFGSTSFNANCKIDDLKVFGSCDFNGIIEVNNLDIKGNCDFNEEVKALNIKIFGSVDFPKKLNKAKDISIYGSVTASTIEAERITIKGQLECSEQLNGDMIEIASHSRSKIKEMVGSSIKVRNEKKLFHKSAQPIEVEVIEGDDIYLENVTAKVVRGKKIVIGPDCTIDLVEYIENCDVNKKSEVKNLVKNN